jgi:uncharacterized membrane protein
MDNTLKAAIAGVLTLLVTNSAMADQKSAQTTEPQMEKCYGIVKAGMNDCQTSHGACAGSSIKDNEPDAFIFLPKGICDRIVGGKKTA